MVTPKEKMKDALRIYNKVGYAYGTLTDGSSYEGPQKQH